MTASRARSRSVIAAHSVVIALLLAACGGETGSATPRDAGADGSADATGTDAAADGSAADDVAADTAPDADADTAPDATPDTAPDAIPDGSGADAAADAIAPDAAPDAALDAAPDADTADPVCPPAEPFDYRCEGAVPDTCPGGICLLGLCLGPIVDADRWATCGDGVCDPCEGACPADCEPRPTLVRPRNPASATTMTIQVHGFSVVSDGEFEEEVYGQARRSGDLGDLMRRFQPDVVNGLEEPGNPRQVIGVEYYGATPADWLSPEDIEEIEAFDADSVDALHRYALIVGKFIRWRMETTGATDVNLLCHSMGCHVTRYMLENDIEGVASSGVVARWMTVAGVIAGARLARLFDNPTVRGAAELLALNTSDFVHMNPDVVVDRSAWWDHDVRAANNPRLTGLVVHHTVATDPRVSETGDLVRLLDLNNPDDEPNDGIVYTLDEYFHTQDPAVSPRSLDGDPVPPTRSYQNLDHFRITESEATGVLAAAALYHRRRVYVTLRNVNVLNDLEQDSLIDFANQGAPPADFAARARVRFDPYIQDTFGRSVVVHDQLVEDRSPELRTITQGRPIDARYPVFEGPVFDEMTELYAEIELLEVDWFPRWGIREWALDAHERLAEWRGAIELRDHEFEITSGNVRATVEVRVEALY